MVRDSSAAPVPAADHGPGRLARLVPAVDWLAHYRREWLRGDVVAALTTWALVVPQAIAYAQIADLSPQAGLFAAFAGLLGYALLGSSRQLIVSPTSSTAAITAALVAPVAAGDVARFGALRPCWPSSSGWSWPCSACSTWGSCPASSRPGSRPGSCSGSG
jgi:MFS superfamily sulfate permease-like transporter